MFHVPVKLPLPLLVAVLIGSIQVPTTIVEVSPPDQRWASRHRLHRLLREGVADDGNVEGKRRRWDYIIILVGVEAVMTNRQAGPQHGVPDVAAKRIGVEIIRAFRSGDVFRSRFNG